MPKFVVEMDDGRRFLVDADPGVEAADLAERFQGRIDLPEAPERGGTLPALIRGAGAAASFLGPVAGFVGGAGSELIAGGLEGDINPAQVLAQGTLGAVPGLPAIRTASRAAQIAARAGAGASMAALGAGATEFAAGRIPEVDQIFKASLLGGVLGGALSARQGQLLRRAQRGSSAAAGEVAPRFRRPGQTQIFERAVRPERVRDVVEAAAVGGEETVQRLAQTEAAVRGERLFKQLSELLREGEINADDLNVVLDREGMSLVEFVDHYELTVSQSARRLNLLSQLKQGFLKIETRNPSVKAALDRLATVPIRPMDRVMDKLRALDDFRRASLVAQFATTSRNVQAQFGRYVLEAFDFALENAIEGRGLGGSTRELTASVFSLFRAFNADDINDLSRLLRKFPLQERRLFQLPAGEVTLSSRYTGAINSANRWQEHFFRRAFFDLRLRRRLERAGMDVAASLKHPETIPEDFIEDAVRGALEGTFQAEPATDFGRNILNLWRGGRLLTTFVNPFPRFFVNAYKFLTDFSPAGYLKLLGADPTAFTDPGRAAQIMSRAHLGTYMLAGALAARTSEFAGPKWYQVRVGENRFLDLRPFAPFSTFLFYAELMRQMSDRNTVNPADLDLTIGDWLQGFASINRISGTGLVALDLLRPTSTTQRQRIIGDILGQYIGGFSVPFRTIKDVVAGVTEDESAAAFRETREGLQLPSGTRVPLVAPFLANVPEVSEALPEVFSPLRQGRRIAETPLQRQALGQSVSTLNPVEQAVARLGIPFGRIQPRTGIGELDRLVAQAMATTVEPQGSALVQSPEFQQARPEIQRLLLLDFIRQQRRAANRVVTRLRPDLVARRRLRRLNPEIRELLEDAGVPLSRIAR